jgi:hypothetical protein
MGVCWNEGLLKSPATDNKDAPNEDAKALWLKLVEGRRSMKRRRMDETSGTHVGAEIERILESEKNVEQ